MHIIKGNFLKGRSDPVGVVVAPTNGVITPAGLVMGAGAALALAQHQHQLRQALARRVEREGVREGRQLMPQLTPLAGWDGKGSPTLEKGELCFNGPLTGYAPGKPIEEGSSIYTTRGR